MEIFWIFVALFVLSSIMSGSQEGYMELSAHKKLSHKYRMGITWVHKWKWNSKINEVCRKYDEINLWAEEPLLCKQNKRLWYYLWIFTPPYIESFPYSSTALVMFTDFWHCRKFFRNIWMIICFSLIIHPVICYSTEEIDDTIFGIYLYAYPIIFHISHKLGWYLVYSKLLANKKYL